MVKKITYSFSGENLDNFLAVAKEGKFKDTTETIGLALKIMQTLQLMAKGGYCEFQVKNPTTGDVRQIIMPHMEKLAAFAAEERAKKNIITPDA